MTNVRKEGLRRWTPTIVAVFALAVHLLVVGRWSAQIEERLAAVEKHADSESKHMPLDRTLELFITRREAEKADKEMRGTLEKIEAKVDFLYQQAQRLTSYNEH